MTGSGWLVTCALGAGVMGCTEAAPTDGAATRAQSIVGGEASGADQDGVLLLRAVLSDGSELLCSSSLVGPNLILTARHCVSYLTDGQFSCSVRGELIDNSSGGGRLGLHLPAASIEVYAGKTPRKTALAHGQQVVSTLSPTICQNDLAFVVLDTALDLPIVPLRIGRPAEPHEASVLVGYGLDGSQQVIDYRSQGRQQKRDLQIAAIGPDSIADGVTTVPPRALILEGPSGCIGDSGGPLLSEATGALLGVYSLQQGENCTASGVRHQMVHVPPFATLITEAFSAAGCEPVLETGPTPEPQPDAGSVAGAGPEPSGAAGAAGASASAATSDPNPGHGSSCSFAPPAASALNAARVLALLATAVVAVRRRANSPAVD
jgi:hypothetical protein